MRGTSGAGGSPGTSLRGLLEKELAAMQKGRQPRNGAPPDGAPPLAGDLPPDGTGRDLCGLALSGGGIRSATFNLGLLQALAQLKLLGMFDYVATVSGGGYIGGFWSAWRHYAWKKKKSTSRKSEPPLFPMNEQQARVREPGARGPHLSEVRHLREFSNFLSPRLGLLSLDTGRMVAATLSAIIPALLASLSLLVLALGFWGWLADLLLVGWVAAPMPTPPSLLYRSQALMALLLTFGVLLLFEWLLERQTERVKRAHRPPPPEHEPWTFLQALTALVLLLGRREQGPRPSTPAPEQEKETPERKPQAFAFYLCATLLVTGLVFLFWSWLLEENRIHIHLYRGVWMRGLAGDMELWNRLYVFTPAGAWLGAAGVLVLLRWLFSRSVASRRILRAEVAAVDRVLSRLVVLAALWSVLAAFWFCGRLIREYFLAHPDLASAYTALKTVMTGAVVGLTALFARVQQLFGRQTSKPVSPGVKSRASSHLPELLAYTVLSLLLLGMTLLLLGANDEEKLGWLLLGAGVITALTMVCFDPSVVGLHAFYRDRLARTFIGAAHGEAGGETEPHPKDDLPINKLEPGPGPLHLICCAANDLASEDPMANLYRGADSAVLSRVGFSVGSEWSTWKDLREQGGSVPTLASAMTASGAAFNSHMGSLSMRWGHAVTFLMSTFNLRLGLWLPHPTRTRRARGLRRFLRWLCAGLPFYKELLGRSRVHSRDVLLSDGGHFENLAFYELVRRHCRFILVSDCGMDSSTEFNDFANAVRRVREDFGVEVRIDLSPLRCCEGKPARQSIVAGDIEYPDGDTGVLLLVKPTLLGNEPADLTQYKVHNADFPHESTGDQFYDEAQWEAYRRLGEHVALTAFRPIQEELEVSREEPEAATPLDAARVFARARYEWLPVPAGYPERFSRLAQRVTELDLALKDLGARRLFREVYKEIHELDGQAKAAPHADGHSSKPVREPGAPSPQELTDALHILRRALLFMEEVFLTEELATYYNHPAYLGVMNYFARWAYAPLLRTWWPLLKTLYSPRFTRFLEQRFSLPGMERDDVGRLSRMKTGFARSCWEQEGGRPPHPYKERLLSYVLSLPHGRRPRYHIQAAQLIVRTRHDASRRLSYKPRGGPRRRVVVWQGNDFYVPPGLWGAGIGEDFLEQLTSGRNMPSYVKSGSILAVRLQVNRDASAARRKRWADEVQLYRSHGFSEPEPPLKRWLSKLEQGLEEQPAMPWKRKHGEVWQSYWLTRLYEPAEQQPAGHGHRTRGAEETPPSPRPVGSP